MWDQKELGVVLRAETEELLSEIIYECYCKYISINRGLNNKTALVFRICMS